MDISGNQLHENDHVVLCYKGVLVTGTILAVSGYISKVKIHGVAIPVNKQQRTLSKVDESRW